MRAGVAAAGGASAIQEWRLRRQRSVQGGGERRHRSSPECAQSRACLTLELFCLLSGSTCGHGTALRPFESG